MAERATITPEEVCLSKLEAWQAKLAECERDTGCVLTAIEIRAEIDRLLDELHGILSQAK